MEIFIDKMIWKGIYGGVHSKYEGKRVSKIKIGCAKNKTKMDLSLVKNEFKVVKQMFSTIHPGKELGNYSYGKSNLNQKGISIINKFGELPIEVRLRSKLSKSYFKEVMNSQRQLIKN